MTDPFAEVDEALRQENISQFWGAYGNIIIGIVVFAVIATAAYAGYSGWNHGVQEKQTSVVLNLIEAPEFPNNIKLESLDLRPAPKAILLLHAAAKALDDGQTELAHSFYTGIAELPSGSPYTDLAILMKVRMQADQSVDPAPALQAILENKESIWRPHAMLEIALYQAEQKQDFDGAIKTLGEIAAIEGIPPSLREKAKALAHVYGIEKANAAPAEKEAAAPQETIE